MDILFCGNDKVFDGVLTAGLSIVRRLKKPRPLTVHIFTMELTRVSPNYLPMTRDHADRIEAALRRHNPQTNVVLYDVTDNYEKHLKENANEGCYCSPYTLLRLLADLYPLPDKVLYLDADVMACKDIGLLYDQDVSQVEYAILETSGEITVVQKPNKRNTIPEDFGIMPEYEGISYDLIVDGKTMTDNLQKIGKNMEWLRKQVEKFGIKPEEVFIATIDGKGQFFCQKREGRK